MSFSSDTKNELAHIALGKKCCMLAEIAGFIRFSGSIELIGLGKFNIVAKTDNAAVARHYKKLIKDYFDVDATTQVSEGTTLNKGRYFNLSIGPEKLSEQILRETGILMIREGMNYITDGIYDGLIKTKCCRKAFLRGAFLGVGSLTDPKKAYHFEISSRTQVLANDIRKLLTSFEGISGKQTKRKNEYIVYLKSSEQIIDVLAIMGAHDQVFSYEDVKIKKDIKNKANRINNCDNANIDKAIASGERQVAFIKKIDEKKGIDNLPEKLKVVAKLRLDNPEATLSDLGEMLNPPMKKSGVNKRLMKLEEISKE